MPRPGDPEAAIGPGLGRLYRRASASALSGLASRVPHLIAEIHHSLNAPDSRGQQVPDPLELSVDTRYLHFFDPASGLSIGHPETTTTPAE